MAASGPGATTTTVSSASATPQSRDSPTQVGVANDWTAIAAGWSQSLALKSDGSLWSWGYNNVGQLGLGDTTDRHVPTKVPGW